MTLTTKIYCSRQYVSLVFYVDRTFVVSGGKENNVIPKCSFIMAYKIVHLMYIINKSKTPSLISCSTGLVR
jgi:hypothetical protein